MQSTAKSLADLILVCRSGGYFYNTRELQRTWVVQFLRDSAIEGLVEHGIGIYFPRMWSSLVEFCSGNISTRDFCDAAVETSSAYTLPDYTPSNYSPATKRLRTVSNYSPSSNHATKRLRTVSNYSPSSNHATKRLRTVSNYSPSSNHATKRLRTDYSLSDEDEDDEDSDTSGNSDDMWSLEPMQLGRIQSKGDRRIALQRLWVDAVECIRQAAADTYYDIDIKIEFERIYNLDYVRSLMGSPGIKHPSLRAANSLSCVAATSFLNKSLAFGGPKINYQTYVYGSNMIRFDNSLNQLGQPFVGSRSTVNRVTGIRDTNAYNFINSVLESAKGILMVDANGPSCGGSIQFTSFSQQDVYIQFTFNVEGRAHYTGNIFYLQADEFCQTDVACRRETLNSACQCDNRLLYWRLCVSITPINDAKIDEGNEKEIRRVIMAALNAFRTVAPDAHVTVSGFTAMAVPHMNDPATRPAVRKGAPPEKMCTLHDWTSRNAGALWRMTPTLDTLPKLLRSCPRLLIIYRPVMMSVSTVLSHNRAMTQYMTYDDIMKKYVLVSRNTLEKGFGDSEDDSSNSVAYACGNTYLMFIRRNGMAVDDEAARPKHLWRNTFKVPSCVYVHYDVLRTMGFNVTAFPGSEDGSYGRLFEHTDYRTGDTCSVICSSLVQIVDETNNQIISGGPNKVGGLKSLQRANTLDSVLEEYRPFERSNDMGLTIHNTYKESSVDVSAFWPRTRLVKVDFVDPALEHVCFVFFVSTTLNKTDETGGMTLEGLYKFTAFCVSTGIIPATILFTIQQLLINANVSPQ